MESVFALVDIFFVSRLGAEAVATVGITESLMTIIYAIGIGLSVGTTALVSRRIGEKKPEEAAVSAVQAIFTGLVVSLLFSALRFLHICLLVRVSVLCMSRSCSLRHYIVHRSTCTRHLCL